MELSQNIHLLGDLLGRVISELESPELFGIEERIRALAKARRNGDSVAAQKLQQEVSSLQNGDARVIAASFAAYFDLVNLAEELQRQVEVLRLGVGDPGQAGFQTLTRDEKMGADLVGELDGEEQAHTRDQCRGDASLRTGLFRPKRIQAACAATRGTGRFLTPRRLGE